MIIHQYVSLRYVVISHLITGQGKAKPQNGDYEKCQIQIAMQQSCQFERGGWRLKRGRRSEKLLPRRQVLLFQNMVVVIHVPYMAATRQVEQRGRVTPSTHKELRIVAGILADLQVKKADFPDPLLDMLVWNVCLDPGVCIFKPWPSLVPLTWDAALERLCMCLNFSVLHLPLEGSR